MIKNEKKLSKQDVHLLSIGIQYCFLTGTISWRFFMETSLRELGERNFSYKKQCDFNSLLSR
jgi:hypothetical protein